MLTHEDEDLLILHGWNSLEAVYGDIPGLSKALSKFQYELVTEDACRQIVFAVQECIQRHIPLPRSGVYPEVDVWVPPSGRGAVVLVVKAPRR